MKNGNTTAVLAQPGTDTLSSSVEESITELKSVRMPACLCLVMKEIPNKVKQNREEREKPAKAKLVSCDSFRSSDLRVMSPARFHCATQLVLCCWFDGVEGEKLNLSGVDCVGFPSSILVWVRVESGFGGHDGGPLHFLQLRSSYILMKPGALALQFLGQLFI